MLETLSIGPAASCSVIGQFLCTAGRSQDGSNDGSRRQLTVGGVGLTTLSLFLQNNNNNNINA